MRGERGVVVAVAACSAGMVCACAHHRGCAQHTPAKSTARTTTPSNNNTHDNTPPTTPTFPDQVDMWSAGVVLFILLAGYPPFHADDEPRLFELIRRGAYSLDDAAWARVSAR